ncbi:hypothetical protein M5C99_02005 [Acidovorax sp. NCPPB 2350]|nr:hypothetical protein M5C99_02005 [Acidovorax sp. NCPPB 2350]
MVKPVALSPLSTTSSTPASSGSAGAAPAPARGSSAMPDGGALSPLKRRPPDSRAESPGNALPKKQTLELPERRPLNDLPSVILLDIVNRLASQPRGHVRARTMLTVIEANKEVRDQVKYSKPIIDARACAFMTERDLERDWKSIDRLTEKFETFNAGAPEAARKSIAVRRERVAFSKMEPLPPTGWRWLLGREEASSAPFRGTPQDIKQRINAFHRLNDAQRGDLVNRMLHLPDARDHEEAQGLLAQALAKAPTAVAQHWTAEVQKKLTEIHKAEQDLYLSRVSNLAYGHAGDLHEAQQRIAKDFPNLFVASRNAVFESILGARDDLARLRGMRAMAGHVDVLDPARKARLFDAVKHAVVLGRSPELALILEEMAPHLSEFSEAHQAEFVQLVLQDPAIEQKLPLLGRLLSGSDDRVPRHVSDSLLQALEQRSGNGNRPAALIPAIREGAGFTHLDAGQRDRLVHMAYADMGFKSGGGCCKHSPLASSIWTATSARRCSSSCRTPPLSRQPRMHPSSLLRTGCRCCPRKAPRSSRS